MGGPSVVDLLVGLAFVVVPIAVPLYLIVRFMRAYERRTAITKGNNDSTATIASLEQEVESLRSEVAQLRDAQQFTKSLFEPNRPRA
jgi:cell division protein FtsB